MMIPALRLNPELDLAPYAAAYRERGMVQVPMLFDEASAAALSELLMKRTPWRLTFIDDGKPVSYTQAGIAQIGHEAFRAKMAKVMDRAREDCGYSFYSYPMSQAKFEGWDAGHPIHRVTDFLDTEPFLNLGRVITGVDAINKTEAMASLYAAGSFLARHTDHGQGARRAAYVIGLSQEWRADWGGLLLFYDEKKDVAAGYTPRFNVVTIFDTKYEHAVSQVSTFAAAGRYSIAGWFRDDPGESVFAWTRVGSI